MPAAILLSQTAAHRHSPLLRRVGAAPHFDFLNLGLDDGLFRISECTGNSVSNPNILHHHHSSTQVTQQASNSSESQQSGGGGHKSTHNHPIG
jgi:hypothetical protein